MRTILFIAAVAVVMVFWAVEAQAQTYENYEFKQRLIDLDYDLDDRPNQLDAAQRKSDLCDLTDDFVAGHHLPELEQRLMDLEADLDDD